MQKALVLLALAASAGAQDTDAPHVRFLARFEPGSPVVLGDPVAWRIDGLEAKGEVHVVADLTDEWGLPWQASAVFVADADGVIDPARHAPKSGDYTGVDPLGLFWAGARTKEPEGEITAPAAASTFTLSVLSGDETVASREMERWIVAPGVRESPLEAEGLVGRMYLPEDAERGPAVVLLGGSGGGILWQRLMAGLLASKGYPALALAYFNAPGLPDRLDRIPVEYVFDALVAFGASPAVDPERIALIGYSKGAELALLAASLSEDVKAVVAYAPSCVVFQAFLPPDFPSVSSWTLEGEDFPFVPLRGFRASATSVENWTTYLNNEEAFTTGVIPVEWAQGATLLLSGRDDTIWPSSLMADRVMTRLEENDFALPFVHEAFPDAGHGIARPGYLPTGPTAVRNGGTAAGNARAQVEGWQTLLRFLEANL